MDDIRRLYLSILQREPDPDGMIIYSRILKETGSLSRVEDILKSSEEFKALQSCVPIDNERMEIPHLGCIIPYTEHQLVVARYDESVNWVPKGSIVYNKGNTQNGIQLFNEGREGETYLHHIIHNYDTLSEYTIFTQANPFEHNPTFVQDVNRAKEVFESFGRWWQPHIPPENIRLNCIKPHIHIGNRDFVCTHPELWEDDGWIRIVRRIKMRNTIEYILPWVCSRLGLREPTTGVPISMCGMFGVHRTRIHMYSRSFYENMRLFLLEHPDHGYVVERFWATLFLLGCADAGKGGKRRERAP